MPFADKHPLLGQAGSTRQIGEGQGAAGGSWRPGTPVHLIKLGAPPFGVLSTTPFVFISADVSAQHFLSGPWSFMHAGPAQYGGRDGAGMEC